MCLFVLPTFLCLPIETKKITKSFEVEFIVDTFVFRFASDKKTRSFLFYLVLLIMSTELKKPAIEAGHASADGVMAPPAGHCAERTWSLDYVTGDLFCCSEEESLAHCISEDCRMSKGIAVQFKKRFEGVEELKAQNKVTGQCAVLKRGRRFVYYLITKKKATQKPTYDSLRRSLEDMMAHCVQSGITRISMPRIGCGLDRLQWDRVSVMLEQIFKPANISITVYLLPRKEERSATEENWRR